MGPIFIVMKLNGGIVALHGALCVLDTRKKRKKKIKKIKRRVCAPKKTPVIPSTE